MFKKAFLLMELLVALGILLCFVSVLCRFQHGSLLLANESNRRNCAINSAIQMLERPEFCKKTTNGFNVKVKDEQFGRRVTVTWKNELFGKGHVWFIGK